MKVLLVGLLYVCIITDIAAQLSNDVKLPEGIKNDTISHVSWLDLFSKLSEFMHDKKEPEVDIIPPTNQTNPDKPIDEQTVNDDGSDNGYEIATTVVYEEVTVTDIISLDVEGGGITALSHSETVSPAINVQNDYRSIGSATLLSTSKEETLTSQSPVNQSLPFLDPNLSLKEALVIFRDYQEQASLQDQLKNDGQGQDPHQNSTNQIDSVMDQLAEETSLSHQDDFPKNESTEHEIVDADGRNRTVEIENVTLAFQIGETEAKSNFTQLSTNTTSVINTVSNRNTSHTDRPGVETSSRPLEVDTTRLELGQNDFQNETDVSMSTTLVSNKPSPATVSQDANELEGDGVSRSSTDYGVVNASIESTPTELPPQFWVVNDKGDDNDSTSKENDFYDDIPSTGSYEEGSTEKLTNLTTPKCDWMGTNNNAFIELIDRLCHSLRPLPIIFKILILLTLGIMSVVVCWITCLCIRCRRRRKGGEEKDSLIEAGTGKEKKSLLQV